MNQLATPPSLSLSLIPVDSRPACPPTVRGAVAPEATTRHAPPGKVREHLSDVEEGNGEDRPPGPLHGREVVEQSGGAGGGRSSGWQPQLLGELQRRGGGEGERRSMMRRSSWRI